MTVVLPDALYVVSKRPHPWAYDADGAKTPAALAAAGPGRPGASRKQVDGSWTLRLDPAEWPVRPGDKVAAGGNTWTVGGEPRLLTNPGGGEVDYVAVQASLDPPAVP